MNKYLRYSLSVIFAFVASITFAAEPYKVLTFPDEGTAGKEIAAYTKLGLQLSGQIHGPSRISTQTNGTTGSILNAAERAMPQ